MAAYGNIRYICHDQNLGMIGNFNSIRRFVSAPYFCVLPDDDVYLPNFFSVALSMLAEYQSANIAITQCLPRVARGLGKSPTYSWVDGYYSPLRALEHLLNSSHPIITNCLFRKSCSSSFVFDASLEGASDIYLLIQLLCVHPSVYSREVTGYWIHHDQGHTKSQSGAYNLLLMARLKAKVDHYLSSCGLDQAYASPGFVRSFLLLIRHSDIESNLRYKKSLSEIFAKNFFVLLALYSSVRPILYWPSRIILMILFNSCRKLIRVFNFLLG